MQFSRIIVHLSFCIFLLHLLFLNQNKMKRSYANMPQDTDTNSKYDEIPKEDKSN